MVQMINEVQTKRFIFYKEAGNEEGVVPTYSHL